MENNEFSIPKGIVCTEVPAKPKLKSRTSQVSFEKTASRSTIETGWSKFMALVYICFIGFFSLVCYDIPASLETEIEDTFNVKPYQFEYLYSMYCIPNIILSYCGGILIDRVLGVKLSALIVVMITCAGQIMFTVGGFVKLYWLLLLARFIYGVGGDSIMVVLNYYSVLWFRDKGLNFVFGMSNSVARMGTSFIFLVSAFSFDWAKTLSSSQAVRIGTSFSISVIASLIVFILALALGWESDRSGKLEDFNSERRKHRDEEKIVLKLRQIFFYPFKFWLIAVIFVSVQTAVLVFVTCSQKLLMMKYHVSVTTANHLGSVFNLVLALSSPLIGIVVDRVGRNLLIINISLALAIGSHLLMAFVESNPYLPLIIFGISCGALYCSVLPLTSEVVASSQLGAAFGMAIALSNLSLALLNILAGYLLGQIGHKATSLFYAALLFMGLLSSITLWIYDRIEGRKKESSSNGLMNVT